MKKIWVSIFLSTTLVIVTSCDQRKEPYKAATYYSYLVLPQSTDEAIQTATTFHYAFVDTRTALQGKLFIFLGGTGSTPQNYSAINKTATKLGYHVINLIYPNTIDGQACKNRSDPNCFENYHEEMIFGGTQSDLIAVNAANSISNRILKLLQRLNNLNPNNGWNQFYEGSELTYSKFVVSGHSQGGGHAAYLGQKFAVDRVVLFSSPNDYSEVENQPANWCRVEFATPADRFYGLMHKRDETLDIAKQYAIWKGMSMLTAIDTSSADGSTYSNYNALVANFEPNSKAVTLPLYHNLTAQDYALPSGDELAHLKQVWIHLIGKSQR
ncbi:MAG: hypothetical protein JJE09_06095 [Bacteroidia bacterium]|nr:hypothetical protein [Bacteroidia bacterium]